MSKVRADKIEFIPNPNFMTNAIELWFPVEDRYEEIASRDLLGQFLVRTSKQFPKEEQMRKEYMRRYIYTISAKLRSIGTQLFYTFYLEVPKKEVIDDVNLEECLSFFLDTIYHPNEKNGELYKFEEVKKTNLIYLTNDEKNKGTYAFKQVMNILEPDGSLTNSVDYHRDLLEQLTSQDVLKFHHRLLNGRRPFIFLYGSEEMKKIARMLDKYYQDASNICEVEFDCNHFLPLFLKPKVIEEAKPYRESELYMVYKITDMQEKDRFILMTISRMLSSNVSPLLLQKLRDEANLVYSAFSGTYSRYGFMYIKCGIDKKNKDKAIEVIKDLIKELSKAEVIMDCLTKLREQQKYDELKILDAKYFDFDEFIDHYFGVDLSYKEEMELLNQLEPDKVQELLSRLKLDLIYFLRGDEDAE